MYDPTPAQLWLHQIKELQRMTKELKRKLIKPKVRQIEVKYGNLGSANHVAFKIPVKRLPSSAPRVRSY